MKSLKMEDTLIHCVFNVVIVDIRLLSEHKLECEVSAYESAPGALWSMCLLSKGKTCYLFDCAQNAN